MRTINAEEAVDLFLGRQGECGTVRICFSVEAWVSEYGDGTAFLIAQRPNDTLPYPVDIERNGNIVSWETSSSDTAQSGYGMCELRWFVGNTVAKSRIWKTVVSESMADAGDPPAPYTSWVNDVLTAGENAVTAVAHPPYIGSNGNWFTWDFAVNAFADSGVSSKPAFVVVGSLPVQGEVGKIYLVNNSGLGVDHYDEYIWVSNAWEIIGTTRIDLSEYAKKSDIRLFYGTCNKSDGIRPITLTLDTMSRWITLKDGDALLCWFLYPPMIDDLCITVGNFGTKPVYVSHNPRTGGTTTVRTNQWRYGSAVLMIYNSEADVWLLSQPGYGSAKYYGTVMLSSETNSNDDTKASTPMAVMQVMEVATEAKAISNVLVAFRVIGVNSQTSDVYIAPKGAWRNYMNSHLNPTVETQLGQLKAFCICSNDYVGFMCRPETDPETKAILYDDEGCTKPTRTYQAFGNGKTYYYKG